MMGRTRVRSHWRRKRGGLTSGEALLFFVLFVAILAMFAGR